MNPEHLLKELWKIVSFLFVLYGFYLLFLFLWDTLNRVLGKTSVYVALLLTLIAVGIWIGLKFKDKIKAHYGTDKGLQG